MLAVIFCLAIYLISIKRCSRLEWTIILSMFLKYSTYVLDTSDTILSWIEGDSPLSLVYISLIISLDPIIHLIYSSQYIKTCFLTKDIVKRAIILF